MSRTELTRREQRLPEGYREQRAFSTPLCDIFENDHELLLLADLPGVSHRGLAVRYESGQLNIEGKREDVPEGATVLMEEYPGPDFRRSFLVPEGIDAGKVSAELRNGVLRLHLPKAEHLRPRQIQVKAG